MNRRTDRKTVAIAVLLSLCLGARLVMAMCQHAVLTSVDGTIDNCDSGCMRETYFPPVSLCKPTCDTLRCVFVNEVPITYTMATGDCKWNVPYWTVCWCENIKYTVLYNVSGYNYNSDDGCEDLSGCGGDGGDGDGGERGSLIDARKSTTSPKPVQ
jgi:hypothetical protein